MARSISWADRAYSIRDSVLKSKVQTYTRQNLEALFEVKRVAAQNLMKLIGGIHSVGLTHVVDRSDILGFLGKVLEAPTIQDGLLACQLAKDPTPRVKPLRFTLPAELRSVMCRNLPDNINLSPGELKISGTSAEIIFEGLYLFAQALLNDLDTAVDLLQPPVSRPNVTADDLRRLFKELEEEERDYAASRTKRS